MPLSPESNPALRLRTLNATLSGYVQCADWEQVVEIQQQRLALIGALFGSAQAPAREWLGDATLVDLARETMQIEQALMQTLAGKVSELSKALVQQGEGKRVSNFYMDVAHQR